MTRIAAHYIQCGDVIVTASEREYQVLRLAAAGLNYGDIGRALDIQHSTVDSYISRWLRRIGAHNKAMLAVWALQVGLVSSAEIWDIWETHAPEMVAWRRGDGADR